MARRPEHRRGWSSVWESDWKGLTCYVDSREYQQSIFLSDLDKRCLVS